jgi:hypothetical protein
MTYCEFGIQILKGQGISRFRVFEEDPANAEKSGLKVVRTGGDLKKQS